MRRQRFNVSKTLSMTEKMAEEVQEVADTFEVSFADVVRACIEADLPKLKERERKRRNPQKK